MDNPRWKKALAVLVWVTPRRRMARALRRMPHAGVLRDAKHAFDAPRDAAAHSACCAANGPANRAAHWPADLLAGARSGVRALFSAAYDALGGRQ